MHANGVAAQLGQHAGCQLPLKGFRVSIHRNTEGKLFLGRSAYAQ